MRSRGWQQRVSNRKDLAPEYSFASSFGRTPECGRPVESRVFGLVVEQKGIIRSAGALHTMAYGKQLLHFARESRIPFRACTNLVYILCRSEPRRDYARASRGPVMNPTKPGSLVSNNAPSASTQRDTLTVIDNRTGRQYEVPIKNDTIRATGSAARSRFATTISA